MIWWEAVLSPALQEFSNKLASGEMLELLRSGNIIDFLLEKLKLAFLASSAVLDDAEEKQFESLAVETWLDMLKASAYGAEDILDVLDSKALRTETEPHPPAGTHPVGLFKTQNVARRTVLQSRVSGDQGLFRDEPFAGLGIFNRLHSLKSLSVISGHHELSTLPEWLLPPTLTSLPMARLPDLD